MKIPYLDDSFFSRLELLSLNLKNNLSGFFGGKHLVKTYGQTVEFSDYREYQLGDDIRRIDWNLYSRFEKHYLKLFTDERQMHVQIFLDYSASMGKDFPQKSAYMRMTAAAMGFLAVHNMDKVSFHIMRDEASENPFGTIIGKNAFFRAIGGLEEFDFSEECDIEKCVTSCPDVSTNNGISIIISDFFTESNWKKAVDFLCYKKRQVLLVQTLLPEEIDPVFDGRFNLVDAESVDVTDPKNLKLRITKSMRKAYAEALADYRQDMKTFCSRRGVDYISIRTDVSIEKILFSELLNIGIMS